MELTRRAMAFALKAHEGQTRQGSGYPYVSHVFEVYALVIKLADMLANITDQPLDKSRKRMIANLQYLVENRTLTNTQRSIANEIYKYTTEEDNVRQYGTK